MAQASTIIPHLSRDAEDYLEGLIDTFGLQNVLNGLACICSGKADHIKSNWQDYGLAARWEKAAVHLMNAADHSAVKAVQS
jgi:hypothetical protein